MAVATIPYTVANIVSSPTPSQAMVAITHTSLALALLLLHCRTSQQQQISPVDLTALQQIKNELTDIPGTDFLATWDFTSPDPCTTFAGITCSAVIPRRVDSLILGTGLSDSPGLAGSLSSSLSTLTELTQLVLFPGLVTGPIPSQLGALKNLRVISLTNNRLTGPIPTAITLLPNLHTLDLSYNHLTGCVPPNLYELTQLKVLILASNLLSGELPSELPSQLLHLDVKNNGIWGRLPKKLPLSLRYLSASGNELWGPLNGLQSLSELVFLDLSMNHLRVESLFLNNNRLIGSVPVEYVDSVRKGSTKTLYLQHNYISGFPILPLPDSVSVCLSYNCMVPAVRLTAACPASAGQQLSRPIYQCSVFNNGSTSIG
ncbi:leucine-rich repeat (LRR) family protein [Actinidia rufa]|uniref:Leucine-rich repeat (LRR) family protein n=1 Tax=Actinidia rufa TaxID=165716 RepID=A0A7J0GA02_9ERIC|nr:leucine-rich repeat (LRR) family protein [Actinidia rufa]